MAEISKPEGTTAIFAATDRVEHVAALGADAGGLGAARIPYADVVGFAFLSRRTIAALAKPLTLRAFFARGETQFSRRAAREHIARVATGTTEPFTVVLAFVAIGIVTDHALGALKVA